MKHLANIASATTLIVLTALPAPAQQAQVQGTKVQPVGQPAFSPGGIGQSPWFGDPGVRQQFQFTPDQSSALTKAYGDAYTKYAVLNQQQQQAWQQMTGTPYNFSPGPYFQRVGGG